MMRCASAELLCCTPIRAGDLLNRRQITRPSRPASCHPGPGRGSCRARKRPGWGAVAPWPGAAPPMAAADFDLLSEDDSAQMWNSIYRECHGIIAGVILAVAFQALAPV